MDTRPIHREKRLKFIFRGIQTLFPISFHSFFNFFFFFLLGVENREEESEINVEKNGGRATVCCLTLDVEY